MYAMRQVGVGGCQLQAVPEWMPHDSHVLVAGEMWQERPGLYGLFRNVLYCAMLCCEFLYRRGANAVWDECSCRIDPRRQRLMRRPLCDALSYQSHKKI